MFEDLRTYKVKKSKKDEYSIVLNQAQNAYIAYNHFLGSILESKFIRKVPLIKKILPKNFLIAHPISNYERFIVSLLKDGYEFKTASEIINGDFNKRSAQIRHDMDGDLISSLECASMLNKIGVKANFYVLHTAQYYGEWKDEFFYRNDCILPTLKKIQDYGHEIGLHTDSLGACLNWGVNPIQVIETEVKWLQKMGIKINGSAPHNSPYVHNASNSAIFKGRPILDPSFKDVKPEVLNFSEKNGIKFPLNAIDEKSLSLNYEANDIYKEYEKKGYSNICYVSIHGFDIFSSIYFDKSNGQKNLLEVNEKVTLNNLKLIDPKVLIYISTHPEYYSSKKSHVFKNNLQNLWNMDKITAEKFISDYHNMILAHYGRLVRQFILDRIPFRLNKNSFKIRIKNYYKLKAMVQKIGTAYKKKILVKKSIEYLNKKRRSPKFKIRKNKKNF